MKKIGLMAEHRDKVGRYLSSKEQNDGIDVSMRNNPKEAGSLIEKNYQATKRKNALREEKTSIEGTRETEERKRKTRVRSNKKKIVRGNKP